MAIEKYIFVVCDVCEQESNAPGRTVGDARIFSKHDGWIRSKGKDICPACHPTKRATAAGWLCPNCGVQNEKDFPLCANCDHPRQ